MKKIQKLGIGVRGMQLIVRQQYLDEPIELKGTPDKINFLDGIYVPYYNQNID